MAEWSKALQIGYDLEPCGGSNPPSVVFLIQSFHFTQVILSTISTIRVRIMQNQGSNLNISPWLNSVDLLVSLTNRKSKDRLS